MDDLNSLTASRAVTVDEDDEQRSAFSKLSNKIGKKEKLGKDSSDAIAASIGIAKYGKKGMAAKAKAGKAKAAK